ncbi:hypothetical protein GCM10025859_64690 [Alicyclobacillus fastidiosus]|nr:hypothetical protein GCM10025859_64690 [Alicyclobacillus fastidiosus]
MERENDGFTDETCIRMFNVLRELIAQGRFLKDAPQLPMSPSEQEACADGQSKNERPSH